MDRTSQSGLYSSGHRDLGGESVMWHAARLLLVAASAASIYAKQHQKTFSASGNNLVIRGAKRPVFGLCLHFVGEVAKRSVLFLNVLEN